MGFKFGANKKVITGREAKREQERRNRREAVEIPEWKKKQIALRTATLERISKQGISPQDLKAEYDKGFEEGFRAAAEPITKGCYAAVCLALKELYGFGSGRCMKVLRYIDDQLISTMDGQEFADRVLDEMKLEIRFNEGVDRIQAKGD